MGELNLAVMRGDGIGPEVVTAAVECVRAAAAAEGARVGFTELPVGLAALDSHGSTLPPHTLERLADFEGWILGPVSHQRYPAGDARYPNPSGVLRKHFDLSANVRPAVSHPGVRTVARDVDLVIVRENTEGFYADRNVLDGNGELRPTEDVVVSVRVVTRRASERVAEAAFALAAARRSRLTVVHKANVLKRGDGLFLDACRDVSRRYPGVTVDDHLVDAFAAALVTRPQDFDVVVTTNMFGDILSDLAAGLTGGLGLAPSLNVGSTRAMAQAVHGSAPDIAGRGIANPLAEIGSAGLLLDWLGTRHSLPSLGRAGARIRGAVSAVLADPGLHTPDLGGPAGTRELLDGVLAAIDGAGHDTVPG
ncbi:MAG TPA: isocitrate/isopropylmalate family dehydrogenase [Rugosimonospora sp.]|nr:isocitrate/isopropylmalate family dehydrogenase [Rugosimonospora sp.]